MSRGIVLTGSALLALALGAVALREPWRAVGRTGRDGEVAEAAREAVDPAHESLGGTPPESGPENASGEPGRPPARPASLRGTRIDGGLVTDAAGRFVPTPDARRLFDYFFAASGEEPEDLVVARIRAEIDRRLPADAARDAHLLLARYLDYRARVRAFAEADGARADLEERLATVHAIRAETLGEESAAALFADEEEADRAALERLRLASDEDVPAAERERRIAELEAALPAEERTRRREARIALDLRRAEAGLLGAGGSAEDLRSLRESTVGPAAAARLAALDQRRAEWQGRLDSYREARAAIDRDPSLDAAARARATEELRTERFDATERLRVEALEGIEPR